MQHQTNIRRGMVSFAHGLLFLVGTQLALWPVMGQQLPPFPTSGNISGNHPSTNSTSHAEFSGSQRRGGGTTLAVEHGFRQASERLSSERITNQSSPPAFSNQPPAVISSSYHRAVVNDPSTHSSLLNDTALVKASFDDSSQNSAPRERTGKLTPLSPPNPDIVEAKTQGTGTVQMLLSVGSSLMVVLGLFMGSVWLYRKSLGSNKTSGLPKNVVQILGRAPVAARQQLVLLRFGSKLVLVSMVQGETRTISEITDPLEVDRLAGLCEGSQPGSISSSFREVLTQGGRA